MTGSRPEVVEQALAFAGRGWPVFPCRPGGKAPATAHGFRDATTDEQQILRWFSGHPDRNLAIATGTPGPDVLDVDCHADGNGFAALVRLARAGLIRGAIGYVRTPSGGLHLYFTGTSQRSGHLPGQHIDFRATGGYVLAPPSQVVGRPYRQLTGPSGESHLDWARARVLLEPCREPGRAVRAGRQVHGAELDRLAGWVAALPEGNRNAGLFWAANRALDHGAADLSPLAAAARHAGLDDPEIHATLTSARKTVRTNRPRPNLQAEAES
jgi:Bifunctional DNA primase/polymerase, N-terminal